MITLSHPVFPEGIATKSGTTTWATMPNASEITAAIDTVVSIVLPNPELGDNVAVESSVVFTKTKSMGYWTRKRKPFSSRIQKSVLNFLYLTETQADLLNYFLSRTRAKYFKYIDYLGVSWVCTLEIPELSVVTRHIDTFHAELVVNRWVATLVPDVLGLTAAEAISAITTVGLVATAGDPDYSDTVPVGRVMSQDPVADTVVQDGVEVIYIVSLGVAP